ncbi:hypothetical protein AB4571_01995 [Vibrio breoganii]|uniref:hypothetical protein n=1 Tax=Vibrio breoganii TaxID=553239 RepID=UPI000C8618B6|nr:hypothetical protein [Vibrio breoganii]PML12685.1 hypothetical protein BCT84_02045 [Vibrio breoganii]
MKAKLTHYLLLALTLLITAFTYHAIAAYSASAAEFYSANSLEQRKYARKHNEISDKCSNQARDEMDPNLPIGNLIFGTDEEKAQAEVYSKIYNDKARQCLEGTWYFTYLKQDARHKDNLSSVKGLWGNLVKGFF